MTAVQLELFELLPPPAAAPARLNVGEWIEANLDRLGRVEWCERNGYGSPAWFAVCYWCDATPNRITFHGGQTTAARARSSLFYHWVQVHCHQLPRFRRRLERETARPVLRGPYDRTPAYHNETRRRGHPLGRQIIVGCHACLHTERIDWDTIDYPGEPGDKDTEVFRQACLAQAVHGKTHEPTHG
jgi:hypothetical protein